MGSTASPKFSVEETSKKDNSETCSGESKCALNETNNEEAVQRKHGAQPDSVESEGPQGRKAAKADYIKKQHVDAKLNIAKEALVLQRKRADEIKRENEIASSTVIADTSPEALEFFRISRNRVVDGLREEEAAKERQAKKKCMESDSSESQAKALENTSVDAAEDPAI
ncbi:hypothetical protein FGB62_72g025 [Gracilaria domingensis]|nr:hypothetical protein FGB62_72g025 [Gracilaria domingensis]